MCAKSARVSTRVSKCVALFTRTFRALEWRARTQPSRCPRTSLKYIFAYVLYVFGEHKSCSCISRASSIVWLCVSASVWCTLWCTAWTMPAGGFTAWKVKIYITLKPIACTCARFVHTPTHTWTGHTHTVVVNVIASEWSFMFGSVVWSNILLALYTFIFFIKFCFRCFNAS